jgi:hypothetical protein
MSSLTSLSGIENQPVLATESMTRLGTLAVLAAGLMAILVVIF